MTAISFKVFCAKERAGSDVIMNCINIAGAALLAHTALADGKRQVALWNAVSGVKALAALALMCWRFDTYSQWREPLYAMLRVSWVADMVIARTAIRSPLQAGCSVPHLLLSIFFFGGVVGLALPALGYRLNFRTHCITQAASLAVMLASNSLACQSALPAGNVPLAAFQPNRKDGDQLTAQAGTWATCQLGDAGILRRVRGVPCEVLLFYLQVVLGCVFPTLVVWDCNRKLKEGFERLEGSPLHAEGSQIGHISAQARRRRWTLSSSQRLCLGIITFLAFTRGLWEFVSRCHSLLHLEELGRSWQYLVQAGTYLAAHPEELLGLLPAATIVAARLLAA